MDKGLYAAVSGLAIILTAFQASAGDQMRKPVKLCRQGGADISDTGFTVPTWFTRRDCNDYISRIAGSYQVGCINTDGSIWLDGDSGRNDCVWK